MFSPWTKLDLQIPARRVSPVVVNGRLYIFWVETTTRHKTEFIEGSSTFTGYRHSVRTKFTYLRLDGRWTPPQVLKIADHAGDFPDTRLIDDYVINDQYLFDFFDNRGRLVKTFDVRTSTDPLGDLGKLARQYPDGSYEAVRWAQWDTFSRHHTAPLETYVPGGWQWERTYPAVVGSGDAARIALEFAPRTDKASPTPELVDLWSAQATAGSTDAAAAAGYLVVEALPDSGGQLLLEVLRFLPGGVPFFEATWWLNEKEWTSQDQAHFSGLGPFVRFPAGSELQIVNGNINSVVIEPPGESLLLLANSGAPQFELWNLGTSLAYPMTMRLTTSKIDGLLSVEFQESPAMDEKPSTASIVSTGEQVFGRGFSTAADRAHWTGPDAALGGYFREIFFHIPFLVADHLNSQQSFADAQRWYHYLFDPTANEPGVPEAKRPWRYREFRERDIQSLREQLTDPDALAAYRKDPFNPHAIARLRPGAYQKSIFMKYIDNLLDWGDSLFSQFTMESVNEATMLYVDGRRPAGSAPGRAGPVCRDEQQAARRTPRSRRCCVRHSRTTRRPRLPDRGARDLHPRPRIRVCG